MLDIFDGDPAYYKYVKEVDVDSLEIGKSAKVFIPSFTGEMEWRESPLILRPSLEDNNFRLFCKGVILTNDIDLIIEKESSYSVREDVKTKKWFIFNYDTGEREKIDGIEVSFKNKFDAKDWCMNKITKGDYEIAKNYKDKKGKIK